MKVSTIQRWALYIFFFSINFEVWDPLNTDNNFSISKLTGLIYFATILPNIKQFLDSSDIRPFLRIIWGFFGLLTVVSLVHINIDSYGFFNFSLFQNIILFWILINHDRRTPGIFERGMYSFALGSIVLSILYVFGIGIEYSSEGRISIFGDNENTIGIRMCISMLIIILLVFQNRLNISKTRYLLLAALPVMLKLLIETGSRVAIIAFVIMFVAVGFLFKTKKTWYKALFFTLTAVAFVFIIQYIMQSEVIMHRLIKSKEEGDFAGRDLIWRKLIPLIEEHPVFGVGLTGYTEYSKSVFGDYKSPHNVLIEILCYTGIIGLIAYLLFLYQVTKKAFIALRNKNILPLLLLIPVAGLILSGQILLTKIGWIIFAYSIASGTFSTNKARNI